MNSDIPLPALLLVEDDPGVRHAMVQTLDLAGFSVLAVDSAEAALARLRPGTTDAFVAVVSDVRLPGASGLMLLDELRRRDPDLPVILITGHGDITMAVSAMRAGAYDFLEKPFAADRLIDVVRRAAEKRRLVNENRQLKAALAAGTGSAMVGQSPAIERVRALVATLAPTGVDILINGETGTGKEVLARALHEAAGARGPFVAINCGALPESVFESEIFGHEAGAFTGAQKRRIGKIEYAADGTLFLDEIESMPLALQVKLLRVLQERVVERLGSNELVPVRCRVVAASKVDLRAYADQGRFRADLYYRLQVAVINLPPLRERREDFGLLFAHFTQQAGTRFQRPVPDWSRADLAAWAARDWPGNVRELKNFADRFVLGLETGSSAASTDAVPAGSTAESPPLATQLDAFERQLIANELKRAKGNVARAAEVLGLPRKTLYDRIKRLGIELDDYKGNGG